MPIKSTSFLLVLLTATLGGAIPVASKIGLTVIPPTTFTFLRFLLASIIIFPFIFKKRPKLSGNVTKIIIVSVLLTLNVVLFAFGVKKTSATISQTLYSVVPIISSVISYFLLKEKFSTKKIAGLIIGLLGVLILIFYPTIGKSQSFNIQLAGNLLVGLAVIIFSFYTVLSKPLQAKFSPLTLTFMSSLIITIILFFLSFNDLLINNDWVFKITLPVACSVLYIGIFGSVGYYLLYQYSIKHASPTVASTSLYIQPLTAFLWSSIFLGEKLSVSLVIGGFFALFGASLVAIGNLKNTKNS